MPTQLFKIDHRDNIDGNFYDFSVPRNNAQSLSKSKFLVIDQNEPEIDVLRQSTPENLSITSILEVGSITDFLENVRQSKKRFIYEVNTDAELNLSPFQIADKIKQTHNFNNVYPGIESEEDSTSFADFREIIIGFKDTTAADRASLSKEYGLIVVDFDIRGLIGIYRSKNLIIPSIFEKLDLDNRVLYAEPNYLGSDDDAETSLLNSGYDRLEIKFDDYWAHTLTRLNETDNSYFGEGVVIAVIDSRVDAFHQDLRDSILIDYRELDFCPGHINVFVEDHGTQCSSVALSRKKINGNRFLGISPRARLLPMSVVLGSSDGLISRIKALNLCCEIATKKRYLNPVNGVETPIKRLVVNCSWQISMRPIPISFEESFFRLLKSEAVVTCSSGNDELRNKPHFPSDYKGAISVAAVRNKDLITSYSNINEAVNLCAPGGDIKIQNGHGGVITAVNGGGHKYSEGTSFAAPYAAGMAAALWSKLPWLNATEVRELLINSCAEKVLQKNTELQGLLNAGRVDAALLARVVLQQSIVTENQPEDTIMPTRSLTLYMTTLRDAVARGNLDEMRGLALTVQSILNDAGDAESEEIRDLKVSAEELHSAIAEKSSMTLTKKDIIVIHEGMVLLDNIHLARSLKALIDTDAEPRITITFSWGK